MLGYQLIKLEVSGLFDFEDFLELLIEKDLPSILRVL
jgi:hypothetical protein